MARHKLEKTNAIRLLMVTCVPYEALSYNPEIHTVVRVAEALGVPPERVHKTLVIVREEQGARVVDAVRREPTTSLPDGQVTSSFAPLCAAERGGATGGG